MELGLEGKVALVAASSRGLGFAVAEELGREGASLVLCARGEEALERARSEIAERFRVPVVAVAGDLSLPSVVERVVESGTAEIGPIDVLVTNTGGPPPGPFEAHSPETWTETIRQNLDSVLNLSRAVLPQMKARRWGRLINVTSISVKQPVDGLILSNSVRAAVTGFARSLANEVAPFGITVNNVLPGYTRTSRVEELAKRVAEDRGIGVEEAVGLWEREIPMGRIGEPREFAAMVAFLASERASYVTGVSITVDGGWVKSLF